MQSRESFTFRTRALCQEDLRVDGSSEEAIEDAVLYDSCAASEDLERVSPEANSAK
jgi:hypothetical protein